MTTQEEIDKYLAKGGKITKCQEGARALPDPDARKCLRIALFALWQIIPVVGNGNSRNIRKIKAGLKRRKYKAHKRGSKWG